MREFAGLFRGAIVDLSPRPGDSRSDLAALRRALSCEEIAGVQDALDALLRDDALFLVDDAHDVDAVSLRLLTQLVNRGARLAATRRPRLTNRALADLDAALLGDGEIVRLGPLGVDDLARLRRGHDAAALHAASAGWVGLALLHADGEVAAIDARVQRRLVSTARATLDTAQMLALDAEADVTLVAAASGHSIDEVADAWSKLDDFGLLGPGGDVLVPVVATALRRSMPAGTERSWHARIAQALRGGGSPARADRVAAHWRSARAEHGEAVAAFVAAGNALLAVDPDRADDWLEHAIAAGADSGEMWAARARAALGAGRRLPAGAPAGASSAQLLAVAEVNEGRWEAAARLLADLGSDGAAPARLAVASVAIGRFDDARRALDAHGPEGRSDVETALAVACIDAAADVDPIAGFARTIAANSSTSLDLPPIEAPDVIGALVSSLYDGGNGWQAILRPAVPGQSGANRRRMLIRAFLEMRRGRNESALQWSAQPVDDALPARDAFIAAAIEAGLARRALRPELQLAAFQRSELLLLAGGFDLFLLEAVEEILLAAAPHISPTRLTSITDRLDSWTAPLPEGHAWRAQVAWIHAQLAVGRRDLAVLGVAAGAAGTAGGGARAGVIRRAMSRWLAVLAPAPTDVAAVIEVAGELGAAGMAHESSRLLGYAALDTPIDSPDTQRLLKLAQTATRGAGLLTDAVDRRASPAGGVPASGGVAGGDGLLSARERQVAELKYLGYRNADIASRLFIGIKTVETHVGRVHAKLGATNKAEFVAAYGQLRATDRLGSPGP